MKGKGKMANGKIRATRHKGMSNKNGIYRAGTTTGKLALTRRCVDST
jgi:hypothetical protein